MELKLYRLTSFPKEDHGGNPAGVVIDADFLRTEDMQAIARKVGFSETAFVLKSMDADFLIRFFTPLSEVGLCGHATIDDNTLHITLSVTIILLPSFSTPSSNSVIFSDIFAIVLGQNKD